MGVFMLNVYYSNQLVAQKDLLVRILKEDPNPDPFSQETILIQSLGMMQWLKMAIAEHIGVSGHIDFVYPTSFVWKQYRALLPEVPEKDVFSRYQMLWRLMRLLPEQIEQPALSPLKTYLAGSDQLKLYQLSDKIADLFDQYLVYRPEWLLAWENNNDQQIIDEIESSITFKQKNPENLSEVVHWQGVLWNALVKDISGNKEDNSQEKDSDKKKKELHRAALQKEYLAKLEKLSEQDKAKLPKRIFVFGMSSIPAMQLKMLTKLSEYCTIHLFFTNPSQSYWGDQQDERVLEKLALEQPILLDDIQQYTQGNMLLSIWGKQGKECFNLLEEIGEGGNIISMFEPYSDKQNLLAQIKQSVFEFHNELDYQPFEQDYSVQIHACHSKMREVEVLHNRLLSWFEQDPTLTPKDIIVLSPDVDGYAPYINAVFSRYDKQDPRHIPFALSDQKISQIDPVIASFLTLLDFKEKVFSVDEILELLNVESIRQQYNISETEQIMLREWIISSGIRMGISIDNPQWQNYNSWQNGLNRLLLGNALKEENNPWQHILALDESYGLSAEVIGRFAFFMENLTAWQQALKQDHPITEWRGLLSLLLEQFYANDNTQSESVLLIQKAITEITQQIENSQFVENIEIDVLYQQFDNYFSDHRSNLNFMVGKVNFCTLLPMRAIPFKIVCVLGMNEGEFPRQQSINNFDLMYYHHRKGDRAKRDDDRYLLLEALLSAQEIFYMSYIGQSLIDNQEKLPSILVSQFLDYLKVSGVDLAVNCHPMTVFSPENFLHGKRSYDEEWVKALTTSDRKDFLTVLVRDKQERPREISLNDLVAFVQDPVKFFFNRQLGIKFEQYDEQIEPNEIFELSALERYQLRDQLLEVDKAEQEQFFINAKLKGELPASGFGELSTQMLAESVEPLRIQLADYLHAPKALYEINCQHCVSLAQETLDVRVQGYIPNFFGNGEVVQWRVGSLKDKYLIQAWIYYLYLSLKEEKPAFSFYFSEAGQVKCLRFKAISSSQAQVLLVRYLHDYLVSFERLMPVLNEGLLKYAGEAKKVKDDEEKHRTLFNKKLSEINNPYFARIPQQEWDMAQIQAQTQAWFDLMCEYQEIV